MWRDPIPARAASDVARQMVRHPAIAESPTASRSRQIACTPTCRAKTCPDTTHRRRGNTVPCPTCSTESPEVALYCYRCGTSLRGSASTRAGSYAVQSSEGVNQFALISTIMPHTNRETADNYRWAMIISAALIVGRHGSGPAADRRRRRGVPDPDRLPGLHLRREHVGGRADPGRGRAVRRHRCAVGAGDPVLLPVGLRRAVQHLRRRRAASASSRCRSRRCCCSRWCCRSWPWS